jgi:hypothetical protein
MNKELPLLQEFLYNGYSLLTVEHIKKVAAETPLTLEQIEYFNAINNCKETDEERIAKSSNEISVWCYLSKLRAELKAKQGN